MVSSNITIDVTKDGRAVFQATLLLPELSRQEMDEVLNTLDLKDGSVMIRLEPRT